MKYTKYICGFPPFSDENSLARLSCRFVRYCLENSTTLAGDTKNSRPSPWDESQTDFVVPPNFGEKRPFFPFGGTACDFGINLIRPLRKCPSQGASCRLSANGPLSEPKRSSVLLFHPCVMPILVQNANVVNGFSLSLPQSFRKKPSYLPPHGNILL